jgi:hypothetical protein
MVKPGLSRAIPSAILGFAAAALITYLLRAAQQMDPVWDAQVAMVLGMFTTLGGFIWGMGGFDPRMSEHGEHEHDEHAETAIVASDEHAHDEHEEEGSPFAILISQIWYITTISLVVMVVLFAFANWGPFFLQTVNEPEANAVTIETAQSFDLPLGTGSFEASQLVVFLGWIGFIMVSLLATAGLIGAGFYFLHRDVKRVKETEPSPASLTPPAPVRWIGRGMGSIARGLKRGLPRFFGYKN